MITTKTKIKMMHTFVYSPFPIGSQIWSLHLFNHQSKPQQQTKSPRASIISIFIFMSCHRALLFALLLYLRIRILSVVLPELDVLHVPHRSPVKWDHWLFPLTREEVNSLQSCFKSGYPLYKHTLAYLHTTFSASLTQTQSKKDTHSFQIDC